MATPIKRVAITNVFDDSSGRELRESYKVKSTTHYEWFKFVDGNRDVEHATKIKKSIEAVGLLICPILCNEHFEIIDGQGRFTACKDLGLPVYYVQQKGIGIAEVRKMNSVSSNWKVGDFVHSYAVGNDKKMDYVYLDSLQRQFPAFGNNVIANAINGYGNGTYAPKIRNGEFECDAEMYEKAQECFSWLSDFVPYVKQIGGKCNYLYTALIWCFKNESVDNSYLLEKFKKYYSSIDEIAIESNAIKQIQDRIYNFNLRPPRELVYLSSDYERFKRSSRRSAKEKK